MCANRSMGKYLAQGLIIFMAGATFKRLKVKRIVMF